MPINYSRTKLSGRLNLNTEVRASLQWITPEATFGISGLGPVNVPLVVEVKNLPAASFEIIAGELPQGVSIVGAALVGEVVGLASGVHNITIRAQSRHLFEDREFKLVVVGEDYSFRWVTPQGLLDGGNEGETTSAKVVAHDPYDLPVTYRRIAGPLPTGTTLNANGVFSGEYGFVDNDTDYTFTIEANNGIDRIEREFTISVWDSPPTTAPVWETPKGDLGRYYEGMDISVFLNAISPNGEDVIYEIRGGSPPLGTQLLTNGVVQGVLSEVSDDTTFRITVGASNDGGEHFSKRLFEITVLQNWPPEWVTPEGLLITEVEGYDLDVSILATDKNSPDQTVYYDLKGVLPAPLTLDPITGQITGQMPPHVGDEPQTFEFAVGATDTLKETVRTFKIINTKDVPPVFSAGDSNTVVEYFGLEKDFLTTDLNPAYDPNGKPVTYSITGGAIPPGFTLDTQTGAVSGILPPAPTEDIVYDFVLTVADKKFNANINVRITDWMNTPPVWETTDIGFGIEGKFFERQLVAVDRERKTVAFSIIGGSFPSDYLSLERDGRMVGQLPMIDGEEDLSYTFDVQADDGILQSVATFTLVVQKNRPPVWQTPAGDLGSPTLGQKNFSYALTAVDPNDQTVTYELLNISRSTHQGDEPVNDIIDWTFNDNGTFGGRMPHTYTEDSTYTIRVAALDGDHPPASNPSVVREFTFERKINTAPVWISEPLLLDTWERASVDIELEAFDPQGQEVTFTRKNANGPLYKNDLLEGYLDLVDGRVVGRLPFGQRDREISFWVDADDSTRPDDDFYKTRRDFTIIARYNEPPVFITPEGLFIKRVENEVIDYQIVASGVGNAPRITYTLTGGALPAGVTMNDLGRITGRFPMCAGAVDESYTITVQADNGTKTSERTFEIIVEKNIAPVWVTSIGEIHNTLANIEMTTRIRATDPNGDRGSPITYSAVGLPDGVTIDPETGFITGKLPLEFDETEYPFVGYASDGLETIQRNFMIRGLSNQPMVWQTEPGLFAWPLDDLDPYSTRVIALDPEKEDLTYTLVSGAMPEGLTFHANGVIDGFTKSVEADEDYQFVVNVADSYYDEDRTFVLRIVDNLPPVWVTPAGKLATLLGGEGFNMTVKATDAYAETVVSYSVQGSLPPGITFNGETGRFQGIIAKTYQPDNIYQFVVVASDGVFNVPRTFEIEVLQNHAPLMVTPPGLLGEVHVNSVATWTILATDDHDVPVTYELGNGPGLPPGMALNSETGVITGKASFNEPKTYGFSVRASDGVWDTEASYSIKLLNDAPVWVTPADLGVANEQTEINLMLVATDPEGHAVTYESTTLPESMSLDSDGRLTGRIPEVTEDSILSFRAVAKDDNVFSEVRQFFFNVKFVSPPVWQTPSTLPHGTEQYPYNLTLVALSNNQVVTYEVVSGVFPRTLTLNSDGTITGDLPVTEGGDTYTFEVEATAGSKRTSREFTLEVRENLAPVWTTPASLPPVAQKSKNYTNNFVATDPNGTPLVYTIVSGTVPPGMTLDLGPTGAYAVLSGNVPAAAQDTIYTFMLGADDGFIRTDRTFTFNITGNKKPVWETSSGSLGEPMEGSLFSFTFLANDPEGETVSYSVVSDTIPTNPQTQQKYLTVNTSQRTISGSLPQVASDQTWSITLRATDPDGAFADVTYTLKVKNDTTRYDEHSAYVTSLMHFDAKDGPNAGLKDSASPKREITTPAGQLNTGQKKFGASALYRPAGTAGPLASFPITADHDLNSAITPEWTIEAWVNPAATQPSTMACIFSIGYAGATNSTYYRVVLYIASGQIIWSNNTGNGSGSYSLNGGAITPGVWTHVAVSRNADGTLRLFVNGVMKQSRANSITQSLISDGKVNFGGSYGFDGVDYDGYIDEVRVTKKCRYVGNFVVPSASFPAPPHFTIDSNTIIATGPEGTAPSAIPPVVATVQETGATDVRYSMETEGFEINSTTGVITFPAFPVAIETYSDKTITVQAQDSNGNMSRKWPLLVRSTAQSPSDLKVQWRMSSSHYATKISNPSNPITVTSITTSTAYMWTAPEYPNDLAFRMSSRVNYGIFDNLTFMSGDHTFEMWVYPTTIDDVNPHLVSIGGANMRIFRHNGGDLFTSKPVSNTLVLQYGTQQDQVVAGGGDLVAGRWNHVAYTRSGNLMRLYVNGVGGPTVSWPSASFASQTFAFNGFSTQTRGIATNLYMRAVNVWSTAKYYTDFTPTWPNFGNDPVEEPDIFFSFNRDGTNHAPDRGTVTNVSGSALTYVTDGSRYVANMPTTTGTLKFNTDFTFLQDNFTLETWVKWDSVEKSLQTIFDIGGELTTVYQNYFRIYNDNASGFGTLSFEFNSSKAAFPSGLTAGAWTHIAVCKNGNQIRLFTNGVGGTPFNVSSTNFGVLMKNKTATINGYTPNGSWTGAAKMANFGFWKKAKYTANFVPRGR